MGESWGLTLGSAIDATDTIRKLAIASVDIAILSDQLQIGGTPSLIQQMIHQQPGLRVLVMGDRFTAKQVRDARDAGASGYIKKNVSAMELCEAVVNVYGKRSYFSSTVSELLIEENRLNYDIRHRTQKPLTPRELEVLHLIVMGMTNNRICAVLGIGIRTVETHRKHLLQKAGVENTASLVRVAIELNLVQEA
jgi:DNA-binding NarL/FixJ family response regulator